MLKFLSNLFSNMLNSFGKLRQVGFIPRYLYIAIGFTIAVACSTSAYAQSVNQPPEIPISDNNGVNLATGTLDLPDIDVGIGVASSGIARSASFNSENNLNFIQYESGGNVLSGGNVIGTAWIMNVAYEGEISRFEVGLIPTGNSTATINAGPYHEMNGQAKLECSNSASGDIYNSGTCTLTTTSGTKITYDNSLGAAYKRGFATNAVIADGEIINYVYYLVGSDVKAIKTAHSSLGWMLKYEVDANYNVIKVGTVNLSTNYCDPNASTCSYDSAAPYGTRTTASGTTTIGNTGTNVASYTFSGNTTTISTPSGISQTATKNATTGQVTSVTIGGSTWNYAYATDGSQNSITTVTAPNGTTRKLTVNPSGIPIGFTDELNRTTTYIYDETNDYITKVVNPDGNATTGGYQTFTYNANRNITSTSVYPKGGGSPLTSTATYVSACDNSNYRFCHRPLTTTDPNGLTTTYTYDANHGGILTVTAPAVGGVQAQTRYAYSQYTPYIKNSGGTLVAQPPVWRLSGTSSCMTQNLATCFGTVDEAKTTITYNTTNILPLTTTTMRGDGSLAQTSTYEYNANGWMLSADGPQTSSGNAAVDKTYAFYDALGRPIGSIGIDPDGSGSRPRPASKTTYNADGQVVEQITGTVTGTTLSALNAMTYVEKVTTEYSTTTGLPIYARYYTYESGAFVLRNVTQAAYDNMFRADCVAQRLNPAIFGSLPSSACTLGTAGTDGNDRIVKYNYDNLNVATSSISAYGTTSPITDFTKSFDATSRTLNYVTDANGNKTSYTYDNFNRPSKVCFPLAASGGTSSTTDCVQNSYSGTRIATATMRDGQVVNYAYDALGRVSALSGALTQTFAYNNFGMVTAHTNNSHYANYSYNSLGWLLSTTNDNAGALTINYAYDAYGRRTSMTYPGGYVLGYAYNDGDELTALLENNTTNIISYANDNLGRVTGITRGNGVNTSAAYDNVLRLMTLGHGGINTNSFTYNQADQIKTRSNSAASFDNVPPTANDNYAHNGLNQIATLNGTAFTHDARGNLSADNVRSYVYNAANLLTQVTQAGVVSTLAYDAENNLAAITKNGTTTKFLYDGVDLIAEYDSSNNLLRRYVHGGGMDNPLLWYEGTGTTNKRYLHADNQGSIIATTDSSGGVLNISTYDGYGVRTNTNAAYASRFGYTGQIDLPEVGLTYYKARIYNPNLGRFLQTDPIGYGAGLNLYAYVGGDPVNLVDPLGLDGNETCQLWYQVWGRDNNNNGILDRDEREGAMPYYRCQPLDDRSPSDANGGNSGSLSQIAGGNRSGSRRRFSSQELRALREADNAICRRLRSRACWASAAERDAARLVGRPIPPLVDDNGDIIKERQGIECGVVEVSFNGNPCEGMFGFPAIPYFPMPAPGGAPVPSVPTPGIFVPRLIPVPIL